MKIKELFFYSQFLWLMQLRQAKKVETQAPFNAFVAKDLAITLQIVQKKRKKNCNYCKKDVYIIKECPTQPPKRSKTTYASSVRSSSISGSMDKVHLI